MSRTVVQSLETRPFLRCQWCSATSWWASWRMAGATVGLLTATMVAHAVEPGAPGGLAQTPLVATDGKPRADGATRSGDVRPDAPVTRRREGDVYVGSGRFESTGDRITFFPEEGGESFRVLENLALDRIARVIDDPSGLGRSRMWSVRGSITEYRGGNYLLIERAILKARTE